MILVVDMNWTKDSLAFNEFVLPIVSAIEPFRKFEIKHFSEITPADLDACNKVVLSGTALKDHTTLKQIGMFNWVRTLGKPILGICAGMQTISRVFGVSLTDCLQIGMAGISTLKENPLFQGDFKAYMLHNFSVEPSQTFETLAGSTKCIQAIKHKREDIYGVLFHPEVRNQEIIQRFIQLI
jgi:GMP synthase-like glutamine amidotransferase